MHETVPKGLIALLAYKTPGHSTHCTCQSLNLLAGKAISLTLETRQTRMYQLLQSGWQPISRSEALKAYWSALLCLKCDGLSGPIEANGCTIGTVIKAYSLIGPSCIKKARACAALTCKKAPQWFQVCDKYT
jgi:hypothetical protein